jgi:hypothetical protein
MQVHRNAKDVVEHVKRITTASQTRLIAIDGFDGCGKTMLARTLRDHLACQLIEIDDFLNRNEVGYVEHLRYEDLKVVLAEGISNDHLVVIEGICILEVLARLAAVSDVHIYVKRVRLFGSTVYWSDREACDSPFQPEEYLRQSWEEVKEFRGMMGEPVEDSNPLSDSTERDLVMYHHKFRPQDRADIVLENDRAQK